MKVQLLFSILGRTFATWGIASQLCHRWRLQVVQVAAGGMHSIALTPEGEVWTTGVNDEGALGRETGAHIIEGTLTLQERHAMGEAHKKMSCGGV